MDCIYQGYDIESYEAGKDLWHARIRRADLKPLILDGTLFPRVEVGFAWPNREAAIADAKKQIDRSRESWGEPSDDACDIQPFL